MTKLQILNYQIQTDIQEIEDGLRDGYYKNNTDLLEKDLKKVHEKIKEWNKELKRTIDEAMAIDSLVEGLER